MDEIINRRRILAELLGFKSYAHMMTTGRMAGNPESVHSFLIDLASRLKAKAAADIAMIAVTKRNLEEM